ncbi:MAG: hypothetical protein AB7H77_10985, partial [Bdellovibrionales bacterium]
LEYLAEHALASQDGGMSVKTLVAVEADIPHIRFRQPLAQLDSILSARAPSCDAQAYRRPGRHIRRAYARIMQI